MTKSGANKISYVIIVVLVVLVLAVAVGFVARFTNNFTSNFATFYVKFEDKTLTSDRNGYAFNTDREYRFDVGYSLDVFNAEKLSYNVKVVPNVTEETDFYFEDEDERRKFSDIEDLSAQFKIEKNDGYFTLMADKTFANIVNSACCGEYSGIPEITENSKDYLKLVISSEDGSKRINLTFNVLGVIKLTPNTEHIIAG